MSREPRRTIVCDASALAPDATTVDVLARLQLTARRLGCQFRLRNVTDELRDLLSFVGLGEVLRVETGRQPEERKQRRRVEEERELDDPPL
jgi:anti-anti-sigma regulatory factor